MAGVGSSRFRRGGRRARLCVAPEWGAGGKGQGQVPQQWWWWGGGPGTWGQAWQGRGGVQAGGSMSVLIWGERDTRALLRKICFFKTGEQDGGGVGGHGVHLSPWMHQEYTTAPQGKSPLPPEGRNGP